MPCPQRGGGCLADMCRRGKVGLADLQMDDLAPRSLELVRTGEHREGGLRSKPLETVCESVTVHACPQSFKAGRNDGQPWAAGWPKLHARPGERMTLRDARRGPNGR